MQKLFYTIDTADWTAIILFGVALMAVIAFMEIMEKEKEDEIIINGILMKNDFDPIGFRFLFGWFIFVGVCVAYITYKYFTL